MGDYFIILHIGGSTIAGGTFLFGCFGSFGEAEKFPVLVLEGGRVLDLDVRVAGFVVEEIVYFLRGIIGIFFLCIIIHI